MPTGPKHMKEMYEGTEEPCRCTIGEDHYEADYPSPLSTTDAENIWLSSGKDEDYDMR